MSIESGPSASSDHPIEPPVGFRDLASIDAKIASLASEAIANPEPNELAKLEGYRVTVISFNSQLEAWCNEKIGTLEYPNRLAACERIIACYRNGDEDLSLKNLNLTSLPENIRHLKELKNIDLTGNDLEKLSELPAETLFKIFDKLSLEDLNQISQSSKYLKASVNNYLEDPTTKPKLIWKAPARFDIRKIQNPPNPPTKLSNRVTTLDLSAVGNLSVDNLKDFLTFFPSITNIKLPTKATTNDHLALLASMTQLQHLDLTRCIRITDAGLLHIASMTQLQHLDLMGCHQITDAGLALLAPLTQLQHLQLIGCNLITDAGLLHIASMTQLQYLDLMVCHQITDAGLALLAPLTQLQHLNLDECERITDAGLAHLAFLTKLQHLDLTGCRLITDAGLLHIASMTQLRYLHLAYCNLITDAGLTHITSLTQLKYLNLRTCILITDAAKEGFCIQHPTCVVSW